MSPPICQCVSCEVDRDMGKPTYLVRWRDTGLYYADNPAAKWQTRNQREALRVSRRHGFGARFAYIRLVSKSKHEP